MSLKTPTFASEAEEADWWYEHRALVEAEFLVAGAQGRLQQREFNGEMTSVPAWDVTPEELNEAKALLHKSGFWIDEPEDLLPRTSEALAKAS